MRGRCFESHVGQDLLILFLIPLSAKAQNLRQKANIHLLYTDVVCLGYKTLLPPPTYFRQKIDFRIKLAVFSDS